MIIITIALYFLIKDFFQYKESNNSNNELIEEVFIENNVEENTIDWNKLLETNKDIIGWIKIENTSINYPILKDNDELKYLKHSYNGKYNNNGSIFTLNNAPFNERITTIYGHNMKNGIMFSELIKYMNEEFLNDHSIIEIYTKEQNYKAIIFSCYSIDVNQEEKNIKLLDFEDEIEYYKNASKYFIGNMDEIKKIIKLSTCSYINNRTTPTTERCYIVAKLEKMQ